MPVTLHVGDEGPRVQELQRLLGERGYTVGVDGEFGPRTESAVRAFQSQNLDRRGEPLKVDGAVGSLTWWSLTHAKPTPAPQLVDFGVMPAPALGGSSIGRAALETAIGQLREGAGEVGGNNMGPYVRKYLNELASEGSSWCAAFVSWCFDRAPGSIPFRYTVGARDLLAQAKAKGWANAPGSAYAPQPGDIVVWWRVRAEGWQGHAGLVHHSSDDGYLYTIEGNKSPKVAGFAYVQSRTEQLLGYVHVPDPITVV